MNDPECVCHPSELSGKSQRTDASRRSSSNMAVTCVCEEVIKTYQSPALGPARVLGRARPTPHAAPVSRRGSLPPSLPPTGCLPVPRGVAACRSSLPAAPAAGGHVAPARLSPAGCLMAVVVCRVVDMAVELSRGSVESTVEALSRRALSRRCRGLACRACRAPVEQWVGTTTMVVADRRGARSLVGQLDYELNST